MVVVPKISYVQDSLAASSLTDLTFMRIPLFCSPECPDYKHGQST